MKRSQQKFAAAVQLLQRGQLAQAKVLTGEIIEATPDHFEAHHLAGVVAFQAGDGRHAIEMLKRALALRPDSALVLSDLGMISHAQGDNRNAEIHLTRALKLAPHMAAAHLNMGNVAQDLGHHLNAERHFREALRLQPKLGAALNNLSRLLLTLGRADEAVDVAQKLAGLAPNNPLGFSRLGAAFDRLGRLEEALGAHQQAVKLRPDDAGVRLSYASSLAGYGRIDEAIAECQEAIRRNPDDPAAYVQLAGLIKLSNDPELMSQMTRLAGREDISAPNRATLDFALGKAEEQRQNYSSAFAYFQKANATFGGLNRYDPTTSAAMADDVISAFPAKLFNAGVTTGDANATPIFIVGMPRSGTTLTEQILCSQVDVVGAGEPTIMRLLVDEACRDAGVTTLSDLMEQVSKDDLKQMGAEYVRMIRQYSKSAARIIDKVPSNFLFVGLIRMCLPNATIIHCRRCAADTCLSIYKTKFAKGSQLFAYDVDHLAAYYAAYQRMMAHWNEVLPGVVFEAQYEKMVIDQAGQSKLLYAHCGLEWTEEALKFFETSRPVHTASIAQVRQPIYDGSRGIAGRYGDAAAPLVRALERAGVDPFAL